MKILKNLFFLFFMLISVTACNIGKKELKSMTVVTKDWKEYNNVVYGYKIRYPLNYELLDNSVKTVFLRDKNSNWLLEISIENINENNMEKQNISFEEFSAEKILEKNNINTSDGKSIRKFKKEKIVTKNDLEGFSLDFIGDYIEGKNFDKSVFENRTKCPVYIFNISNDTYIALIFQLVYCSRIPGNDLDILKAIINSLSFETNSQ